MTTMPIDPFTDELIDLNDVPAQLPERVALSTVHGWWRYGSKGVHLETVKIARTRYTTRAALLEFFQQRAAKEAPPPDPSQTERSPELTEQLREARLL